MPNDTARTARRGVPVHSTAVVRLGMRRRQARDILPLRARREKSRTARSQRQSMRGSGHSQRLRARRAERDRRLRKRNRLRTCRARLRQNSGTRHRAFTRALRRGECFRKGLRFVKRCRGIQNIYRFDHRQKTFYIMPTKIPRRFLNRAGFFIYSNISVRTSIRVLRLDV